ncbi:hypothetical protein D3C87_430920 [compost metagenome]
MLADYLKFILFSLNFSPVLLILWFVNLITKYSKVHTLNKFTYGDFYLLGSFVICIAICWFIIRLARRTLPTHYIQLKSIKSADMNFQPMFLSYFLPIAKLEFKDVNDIVILVVTLLLFLTFAIINNQSYSFNPILRLVFGYKHYEVQTKKEFTYIMLSKKKLINPSQVNSYIQLADYVILNATTNDQSK